MVFHAYDKHLVIANEHDMIRYIVLKSTVFYKKTQFVYQRLGLEYP